MKHLILTILFTLSLFAQEIGVPYVDTREAVAQSAALSPDGETFYTYANNTLTHWSLSPVKVIDSVKIDDVDFINRPFVKIYAFSNNKIIFFRHRKPIGFFDWNKKKFIEKSDTPYWSVSKLDSSIIAIDKDRTITKWDASNVKVLQKIQIPKLELNCDECHDRPLQLFKSVDNKNFVLVTGIRFLVLDSTTFKIIKEMVPNDKNDKFSDPELFMTAMDIYLNSQLDKTNKMLLNEGCGTYSENINLMSIKFYCGEKNYSFYRKNSLNMIASTYEFSDESWLVMAPDGHFDGSANIRKYLYIKSPSGASVAIDDATYNKFHKKINLKD
jgi:hypothetical protein